MKQAYDIFYETTEYSNYLRLSRKSLLLADMTSMADLYSLDGKANILNLSPKKLETFLQPILKENSLNTIHELLKQEGYIYDRVFAGSTEYLHVLKLYMKYGIDLTMLKEYQEKLKKYFSGMIKEGDLLFDIGYSGRPETALSNLLGFPVNSLYIHTLKDIAEKRQRHFHCTCRTFYNYKPVITGVVREHLLMELGPSTIGYEEKNGSFVPVLEEKTFDYTVSYVTNIIQQAALDFITDYKHTFREFSSSMVARGQDLSIPLEYYLHNSKEWDRRIFASLEFEDDMGGGGTASALAFWNDEIARRMPAAGSIFSAPTTVPFYEALEDVYVDGLFVKFYKKLNQLYPRGSRRRELIKKMAGFLVH